VASGEEALLTMRVPVRVDKKRGEVVGYCPVGRGKKATIMAIVVLSTGRFIKVTLEELKAIRT